VKMTLEDLKKQYTEWEGIDRPMGAPQPCIGKYPHESKHSFDCPRKQDCLRYVLSLYCQDGWTLLAPHKDCTRFMEVGSDE
jgi:hypothetical protein